jgi:hypothetical protein
MPETASDDVGYRYRHFLLISIPLRLEQMPEVVSVLSWSQGPRISRPPNINQASAVHIGSL